MRALLPAAACDIVGLFGRRIEGNNDGDYILMNSLHSLPIPGCQQNTVGLQRDLHVWIIRPVQRVQQIPVNTAGKGITRTGNRKDEIQIIGFSKVRFQKAVLNPADLLGPGTSLMIDPFGSATWAVQITGAVIHQVDENRWAIHDREFFINDARKQGIFSRLLQGR